MKNSDADRVWERLTSCVPNCRVTSFDFSNLPGLQDGPLLFEKPINAIVGHNGSGKTSLLTCIRGVLNSSSISSKAIFESAKLQNVEMSVTVNYEGNDYEFKKATGATTVQIAPHEFPLEFIDTAVQVPAVQHFCRNVTNLNEQLAQHESLVFSAEDLGELSYLVGKEYSAAHAIDLADDYLGNEERTEAGAIQEIPLNEPIATITDYLPVFQATSEGITYSSSDMGLGELALFYIYWRLRATPVGAILLIEEPESFVAPRSQINLTTVIAKWALKKRLLVVISTHSEHVLERIEASSITILARNQQAVHQARTAKASDDVLMHLRLDGRQVGAFLVEDWCGYNFLRELLSSHHSHLLRLYKILPVFGDANVIQIAKLYPKPIEGNNSIIGVLDADVRGTVPKTAWPCVCLPGTRAPEIELWEAVKRDPARLSDRLGRTPQQISDALGLLGGIDHHDFISEFGKKLGLSYQSICHHLIAVWNSFPENIESTGKFYTELNTALEATT